MRTKLMLGALLALLLAVAGVSLAFAGSDENGGGNGDEVHVLHITLRHIHDTNLDLGASGPSVNDRFSVFGDVLRDGERIGAGGYECVTLLFRPGPTPASEPAALTDQCIGTFSLPRGQIAAQGLVDRVGGTLPVKLAITGGTGAYRTAHGEAETSGPTDGDEPITVRLILTDD
jgi:hypothetical protein